MPTPRQLPPKECYRGGGGPFGMLAEGLVLDAVGRIGTAGVLEAAGRTDSGGTCVGTAGPFVALGRMRNATLVCRPAITVTLSSAKPNAGCHARTWYFPAGIPSMLNVPAAVVCAK